jgi:hypothetical protein
MRRIRSARVSRKMTYTAAWLAAVLILLFSAGAAQAVSTPNSLWLGTDNTNTRPVLNTDRSGTLLRQVDNTEATGIAIDLAKNTIYFGTASPGNITPRNLNTLAAGADINPPTSFYEDMAFDGTSIWRCGYNGPVYTIDPATGTTQLAFSTPFTNLGIAWDGSHLWISEFANGGLVARYDTSGTATGESFHVAANILAGGLAYDTTDGTLWLGTYSTIYHYTTIGGLLGSFNVPVADGRFVDGLEFQGAAPIPGAFWLLTSGLVGLVGWRRYRKN